MLAFDLVNSFNAWDVDDDGYLVPLDALLVINALNRDTAPIATQRDSAHAFD